MRFALALAISLVAGPAEASKNCPYSQLVSGFGKAFAILRRQPKGTYADLVWFKFNVAKKGEKDHYVDIPFVDLGVSPFKGDLIPDAQRQFQPEITEGAGFSKMVQGQALLTKLPDWVRKFLAERSLIMRGYLLSDSAFFADMPTYFLRLGYKTQPWIVDRIAASDKLSQYILERTREISSAGVRELEGEIARDARRPIRLFSIGGGPMVDTLNMLLKLQREQPALADQLRKNGTPVRITLADISDTGANFGQQVLKKYLEPGMPLHGLNVEFEYHKFDWNQPSSLDGSLLKWKQAGEFVVAHSEGGIGEYGSNEVLSKNLSNLAARLPRDSVFIASAFLPDAEFMRMKEERGLTNITVFPRNTTDVQQLAQGAGWSVDQSKTVNILDQTFVFTLRRSSSQAP